MRIVIKKDKEGYIKLSESELKELLKGAKQEGFFEGQNGGSQPSQIELIDGDRIIGK